MNDILVRVTTSLNSLIVRPRGVLKMSETGERGMSVVDTCWEQLVFTLHERILTRRIVPDSLWYYAPNKGAPVFFAVAFGISTAYHLWQTM